MSAVVSLFIGSYLPAVKSLYCCLCQAKVWCIALGAWTGMSQGVPLGGQAVFGDPNQLGWFGQLTGQGSLIWLR